MSSSPNHDTMWMQRALALAERGRGHVEPNPLVGAVLVRDDHVIGEGWHQRFGEAHAEIHALAAAGTSSRSSTLYVTLEPCCHHGKTPPCTTAIIEAGVGRVVAAMADPCPQVSGQGAALLRAAGIAVEMGLCESDARRLNGPYLKLLETGRPYVHAKWAMTLDGKIATRTGDSKWISGEASRRKVHELRGRMDAIIVGIGTALADDPLLTARPSGPRTATRIVLDSLARLPSGSQLVATAQQFPTLVAVGKIAVSRRSELEAAGCETLLLPDEHGRLSIAALVNELGRRRFTNVLVEGGADVLGSFLNAAAIDEVHVFIANKLVGGGKSPFAGHGLESLANAMSLSRQTIEVLDNDVYVRGAILPVPKGGS